VSDTAIPAGDGKTVATGVSPWNRGGEGEMMEPPQGSTRGDVPPPAGADRNGSRLFPRADARGYWHVALCEGFGGKGFGGEGFNGNPAFFNSSTTTCCS